MMQEQVYAPIHNVNDLKQCLLDVWATQDQKIIDKNFVNLNFKFF